MTDDIIYHLDDHSIHIFASFFDKPTPCKWCGLKGTHFYASKYCENYSVSYHINFNTNSKFLIVSCTNCVDKKSTDSYVIPVDKESIEYIRAKSLLSY